MDRPQKKVAGHGRNSATSRERLDSDSLTEKYRVTSRPSIKTIRLSGRGWHCESETEALDHFRACLAFVEATRHCERLLDMRIHTLLEASAAGQMLCVGCFANGTN